MEGTRGRRRALPRVGAGAERVASGRTAVGRLTVRPAERGPSRGRGACARRLAAPARRAGQRRPRRRALAPHYVGRPVSTRCLTTAAMRAWFRSRETSTRLRRRHAAAITTSCQKLRRACSGWAPSRARRRRIASLATRQVGRVRHEKALRPAPVDEALADGRRLARAQGSDAQLRADERVEVDGRDVRGEERPDRRPVGRTTEEVDVALRVEDVARRLGHGRGSRWSVAVAVASLVPGPVFAWRYRPCALARKYPAVLPEWP